MIMTKRYLLFAGENYYPGGGWCDHRGSFDSAEEACQAGGAIHNKRVDGGPWIDWWHVIDLLTGKCVGAESEYTIKEFNAEQ